MRDGRRCWALDQVCVLHGRGRASRRKRQYDGSCVSRVCEAMRTLALWPTGQHAFRLAAQLVMSWGCPGALVSIE
jgi:hypothetical protein